MASPSVQVPDQVLAWLHSSLAREYRNLDRTYTDIARTLSAYASLRPRTDVYTSESGASALLLLLEGTLPVQFRGVAYRFPVALWIPHLYPREPPIVFVTPTRDLAVRPGQHVSVEGRVYHPYLAQWSDRSDRSTVIDLLAVLQGVFAKEPPLIARQQRGPPQGNPLSNGQSLPLDGVHGPERPTLASPQPGSQAQQEQRPPPPPPKPSEIARPLPTTSSHPTRSDSIGSAAGPRLPPKPYNTSQSPQTPTSAPSPPSSRQSASYSQAGKPLAPLPKPPAYQRHPLANQGIYVQQQQHPQPQNHQPLQQPQPLPPTFNAPQIQSPRVDPSRGNPPGHQVQYPVQAPYQPQLQHGPPAQGLPHPKQPVFDLLSLPLDATLPSQTSNAPAAAPPIPPNPEKDALLRALSATLRSQLQQAIEQNQMAVPALQAQQAALQQAQQNMQSELYNLEQLNGMLDANEKILHESTREADRVMENVKRRELPSVDDVLVAPTVVGEQLYKLVADERSIADALFALTRALDKGRISAEVFIKQTRSLAREQFLQKALIKKIGRGMNLAMDDDV